jgi:ubiquinol-cytochrome c reductase cytochrome b subunit
MAQIINWIDKRFPLSEFIEKHITGYPTPKNLNYLWNFGSVAGAFFVVQIITGVWLAMYYKPDTNLAFDSVQHIMRDVHFGWLIRYLHAIGPTGIFFSMFVHVGRGFYYGSYKQPRELLWWIGIIIFLFFMAESFMGYLLPWGQMSFWSATVITNLFSTIPVVGRKLIIWLRGDFAVGDATLTRFFSLHTTLLPIGVIALFLVMHLAALHKVGSNNPEGINLDKKGPDVVPFAPYYITKDLWFISLVVTLYFYFVFFQPDFFLEPLNNEPANPLKTPLEIAPEWYFLPFYAILKSIPNKFGGVIAMGSSILITAFLPYLDLSNVRSSRYRPLKGVLTWIFFVNFLLLGYVGMNPPYKISFLGIKMSALGLILTIFYFLYFLVLPLISALEPIKSPIRRSTNEGHDA